MSKRKHSGDDRRTRKRSKTNTNTYIYIDESGKECLDFEALGELGETKREQIIYDFNQKQKDREERRRIENEFRNRTINNNNNNINNNYEQPKTIGIRDKDTDDDESLDDDTFVNNDNFTHIHSERMNQISFNNNNNNDTRQDDNIKDNNNHDYRDNYRDRDRYYDRDRYRDRDRGRDRYRDRDRDRNRDRDNNNNNNNNNRDNMYRDDYRNDNDNYKQNDIRKDKNIDNNINDKPKNDNILNYKDVRSVQLTRKELEKRIFEPYFNDFIKGLYVRIFIGQRKTSRGTLENIYRLCKILETQNYPRQYKLSDKKRTTSTGLCVCHGKDTRLFKITQVSDSAFTEMEFEIWKKQLLTDNIILPKKDELSDIYLNAVKLIKNFRYDDDAIKEMINKKRNNRIIDFKNIPNLYHYKIQLQNELNDYNDNTIKYNEIENIIKNIDIEIKNRENKKHKTVSIKRINELNKKKIWNY